jgi:hypothetical protein
MLANAIMLAPAAVMMNNAIMLAPAVVILQHPAAMMMHPTVLPAHAAVMMTNALKSNIRSNTRLVCPVSHVNRSL